MLWLVSCDSGRSSGDLGESCTDDGRCLGDLVCLEGTCVSADAAGGDKSFPEACSENSECKNGLCGEIGGAAICTTLCGSDADCAALAEGACCHVLARLCLPAGSSCEAEDGDSGDSDGDGGVCQNGDARCFGNDLQLCNASGEWALYRDCEIEGKICDEGYCVGTQPDGDAPSDGDVMDGDQDAEMELADGDALDGDQDTEMEADGDAEDCVPCTADEGCAGDLDYCFIPDPRQTEGCCACFCDVEGCPGCPRGFRCDHGRCTKIPGYCRSDAECALDQFCNKRPGADDGLCYTYCFEQGQSCPTCTRCQQNPQDLNYGQCEYICEGDPCSYDGECGVGEYCAILSGQASGECVAMCGPDNPCPGSLGCCPDGRCAIDCLGACECNPPCPPPYLCDGLYCTCVLPCPACPEGSYCDESSAPNCKDGPCTNPLICGFGLRPCCPGYNCSAILYGLYGYCI
ncbi:MAG: hypothetical protein C4523_07330 [Myxococcales bacterium]|nr:MAG: hypothetical protein C4523_07330 [Myxococcales bacterium]